MTSTRLPDAGAGIVRSRPIRFTFDGTEYGGFQGDTLASALLANGVTGGFASPILGRPRGIMTAGVEEPNAFVEVRAPWFEVIAPATRVELVDGLVAEPRMGVGRLPADGAWAHTSTTEHRWTHVELLVIGEDPVGSAEAKAAAERGDRVMAVTDDAWEDGGATPLDGVTRLARASVLGLYDQGSAVVHERARVAGEPAGERVWHVRAGRVVIATGAQERLIPFANNDRPGIMLAGAAGRYLHRQGVRAGERVVVFTTNDSTSRAAETLENAGAEIAANVDVREGEAIADTLGSERLSGVLLADGRRIECDLLLVSGGWSPAVQLWRAIGGGVRYDSGRACFVPDGNGPPWLEVVGAAAGDVPESAPYRFVPADDLSRHFVDLQRDQTVADIARAVEGGLRSVEHVKRATYIGTAIDQGRTSGVVTAEIVDHLLGAEPGAQGPTSARPPSVPVSYAALGGPYRGQLLDPVRRTPIHPRHVERGAVFENVGQWKRPWYFPRPGEDMDAAVRRECLAVRTAVGVMDASTLGKIEVEGPEAPEFLDRMYTNAMSTLRVGHIRYGMMLGLDGMAMDDGVAMRLADDRYFVTTTTGGAAAVLEHFEEWLQTEWPELRVYCTGVTEQWSTVAVAGPRARAVVAGLGTDIGLSAESFPFMTFRDGVVAGIPARVARVSFSGELAYEINVGGRHGLAMWEAVMEAGEPLGIAPYGTEAMHVLRAEKGFPILGQDTDGTVTPHDLGMSWIVNERKGDFVGRRSLRRPDTARPDRKQLVGLLPAEPEELLPEGAQLVAEDTGAIPMPMIGHVTSSYSSSILERTIALAMVERGRERRGETLFAPLQEGTIAAEVTDPVFYDPGNERRDG